jgi:hypothetical protein
LIVWLWDSSGPASGASGITDNETQARRAAEAYMHTAEACTARVERAHLRVGIHALTTGYERTGNGWEAKKRRDGPITWTPFDPSHARALAGRLPVMSALYARDSVYRPSGDGDYRDDPSYRMKAGDSWLKPANAQQNTQDKYVEYGIEQER